MKNTGNIKCPHCEKNISSRAHEDSNERLLKVRVLKFNINGGPVSVKCRHCGHLVKLSSFRFII